MTTDPTSIALVHTIPGMADVPVEQHEYITEQGPLAFDLYRPPGAAIAPAVILVSGLPDPGVAAMLGKPIKDWASYIGWARLLAASGMAAITYVNRTAGDVTALVHHLRDHAPALRIDPDRLAVWACSGHVPNALALLAHERFAAAALLYGYTLDLDGSTAVADAAKKFYFAAPPVALAELPRALPMLIVRAGADATPGLNEALDRFVAAARDLNLTRLDHPGPHSFDLREDSPRTHEVIEDIVAFLRRALLP